MLNNPALILKLWNKVNRSYGPQDEAGARGKDEKKKPSEKDKLAEKQGEKVTKGLTVLRNVARAGVKAPGEVKRFETTRDKVARTMLVYCKTVKTSGLDSARDKNKYRKLVRQLTVVVQELTAAGLSLADEADADPGVLLGVDDSGLDKALEDPNLAQAENISFEDEPAEQVATETGDSSPRSPPPEPAPAAPGGDAVAYQQKRKDVEPPLLQALKANQGDTNKMRNLFTFAQEKAGAGKYTTALQALTTLENLLTAPGQPVPPAPTASREQVTATLTAAKAVWPPEPAPPRRAVTPAENDALTKLPPEILREQNLTQRDPRTLFNDQYMSSLVGLKIQGANDNKLKELMRKLAKGVSPGERKGLIAELATIRGVPAAKLDAEYDRFMILRAQQEAIGKEKNEEAVPDCNEDLHNTFMSSNPQLVFGKVIGDTFGVDPVFGALLSPTGGLVGPGNKAVQMDDDDPTGYHGIVHDAAGYLFNYHNQGPGYDYLGREAAKGHKTSDPLTGQQSGMRYWHEKLDPGVGTVVLTGTIDTVYAVKDLPMNIRKGAEVMRDYTVKAATDLKVKIDKEFASARQTVGDSVDRAMHAVGAKAKAAETPLERAAQEAADAAHAAKARVTETASTALASAKQAIGAARDEATKKLRAASDFIWS